MARKEVIRCYDNNGETTDRCAIVFMDRKERDGLFAALAASSDPFHSFGQHTAAQCGPHLGYRIPFYELPDDVQKFVRRDLPEMSHLPHKDVKEVTYHRPPTPSEIRFGEGATHYADFELCECTHLDGTVKAELKSRHDGLWYSSR